ncbi:hypothetical protein MNBD_ALPHA06-1047 [hydrothermal vent metagenome]|uniref:Lipid/polyisoprenoid-binding YceI-like domain-containing protein n=1 Tax=hydrothermal vent metagenome TaxID=652676 RepID=A0A3B0RVR2_9ZZZZ
MVYAVRMKIKILHIFLLSLIVLVACAKAPVFAPAALPPGQWQLDPDHASIVFTLSHGKGLSQFTGRFDSFDASLLFDVNNPQASKLLVQIDANSINTGVAALDKKLIAHRRVLAAKTNPVISFESTKISEVNQRQAKVTGLLSLRGQSRSIVMQTKWNGSAFDPLRRSQVLGFSATTSFDRRDFGADAWKNFGVGNIISVTIEAEFIKAPIISEK